MHGLVYNLGILSPSPHPISQSLSLILSLPPSPGHLAFWVSLQFPQKHAPNTTGTVVIASYQQSSGQTGRLCVLL